MEELILKMHEETLQMQKEVSEMSCMILQLEDAISEVEISEAQMDWRTREDVENARIEISKIKRIIGIGQTLCKEADEILKKRENREEEDE